MGLDSVELGMAFEEEFGIEIPDAAAEKMITIGDVVDHVASDFAQKSKPMDKLDIFYRVRSITAQHLNVDRDKITRSSRFIEDLGLQ